MIDITVGGVAYPVPSSAADTDWAAKQVAFEQALAEAVPGVPEWTDVTVYAVNGSGTLQYRKDTLGYVWLRGLGALTGPAPDTVTTLPSGFRPPVETYFVLADRENGTPSLVFIQTDGQVIIGTASGANPNVDFSQAFFDTQAF